MFVYSKKLGEETGNLEINSYQFDQIAQHRASAKDENGKNVMEEIAYKINMANKIQGINAVRSQADLYKTFDQTILRQFRPEGEFTLLDDLIPLSRSVRINAPVYEYVRSGGRGWAHTSMSGQIGAALDATQFDYDGTMVPVHDTGFKFHWRDPRLNNPDAYDVLSDAQAASTETVKLQYVDYIYDGFKDDKGNFIKVDGKSWKGLRGDERVAQVTLTTDFSAAATTGQAMRDGLIKVRDTLRITNNSYAPLTLYVSPQIMSNTERYFSDNFMSSTILEEWRKLNGIAAIKEDAQLSGNELLLIPLTAGVIAPIVGSAFATVTSPRPEYNSDYVWRTWGAAGLMVKTDIAGKFSVLHGKSA